jgi:hypothetical protein
LGVGVQAGAKEEHRICERREGFGAVSSGTFGREFSSLGREFKTLSQLPACDFPLFSRPQYKQTTFSDFILFSFCVCFFGLFLLFFGVLISFFWGLFVSGAS